jgi:hypothetical protein
MLSPATAVRSLPLAWVAGSLASWLPPVECAGLLVSDTVSQDDSLALLPEATTVWAMLASNEVYSRPWRPLQLAVSSVNGQLLHRTTAVCRVIRTGLGSCRFMLPSPSPARLVHVQDAQGLCES